METHQFCQFLLQRGMASEEELFNAINIQDKEKPKIGEIAIRERILSVKEVMKVLYEQAGTTNLFGELAVELGYLSEADHQKLITISEQGRPRIGEILVDMKKLQQQELNQLLEEYRQSLVSLDVVK